MTSRVPEVRFWTSCSLWVVIVSFENGITPCDCLVRDVHVRPIALEYAWKRVIRKVALFHYDILFSFLRLLDSLHDLIIVQNCELLHDVCVTVGKILLESDYPRLHFEDWGVNDLILDLVMKLKFDNLVSISNCYGVENFISITTNLILLDHFWWSDLDAVLLCLEWCSEEAVAVLNGQDDLTALVDIVLQ